MGRDRRKALDDAIEDVDDRVQAADANDAAEKAAGGGGDAGEPVPEGFVPFSEEDREEANAAFQLLLDAGYVTFGSYDLKADPEGRKIVTLQAFLPNTLEGRDLNVDADLDADRGELPDPDEDDA